MLVSWIYPSFYYLLVGFFYLFRNFNRKWKLAFNLRQKNQGVLPWLNFPPKSQPIWFHCASGEYEYARPVIRALKQKYPLEKILVTYFSPSVEKTLSEAKDIDFYCPTPWDTPKDWKTFIKHHKPKALLIARTDLWPMMIATAKKAKIPCLLFSKTANRKNNSLKKWVQTFLLKKMDAIFCVSKEDHKAIAKSLLSHSEIRISGDTRYDQCFFRLKNPKTLKPLNNFNQPIFVAGSTWPSDEKVLLPFFKKFSPCISFVIAPHEPNTESLDLLTKRLQERGLEWQLYSKTNSWDPGVVLVIDELGILADLYAWGHFAFIGGSMRRKVHSVMEALVHGLLTFVGPNHFGNREALHFKEQKVRGIAPVQVIDSTKDIEDRFTKLQFEWTKDQRFNLKLILKEKAGASKIIIDWLEDQKILKE